MKKLIMSISFMFFALVGVSSAFADAEDNKSINTCVSDNKDETQTKETVLAYCTCMNGKMSSSETQSVSEWEKGHPAEEAACGKSSGWVGK